MNTKDVRLLSLDGGGTYPRRFDTAQLQRIFFVLDSKLDFVWERLLKPFEFFYLVAGTTNGRLIAIMLGTL